MTQLIVYSILSGIWTAVLINSTPYQLLLKYFKINTSKYSEFANCGLCMGYWAGSVTVGIITQSLFMGFLIGAVAAVVSELITRKLNTIEL